MAINRRQFIVGASQVAIATWLLPACTNLKPEQWIVSTCNDQSGQTMAAALDSKGQIINTVNLPARGHDSLALPHKPGHALVFARRPGSFAVEVDFSSGTIVKQIQSQADSHFYGHGVFSSDFKYLYTTENLYDKKRGLIVVRDAQTYQVLERYESGGIGPHELALMPDKQTIVIANGGIETHPNQHRKKLNIETMQPNLAYLDLKTGQILGSYQPPDHQLSLRHLDVAENGTVYVGAQYQGHKSKLQPLLYSHQGENLLRAFQADQAQWHKMQQYTASVLVKDSLLCVSCPRGAHLSYWDTQSHRFTYQQKMRDVSGLAKTNKQIYASTGRGQLTALLDDEILTKQQSQHSLDIKFDNHMTIINGA
ncbi:DUF1513 domain-containing protein [Paraglaciecola sp. 2405UD69-4]|uniref:DUF1513 domain-containing protein n=1 Tax=Paraglaciecola sp. 2405UD69-4 TaxID=3391836 RepID=UPI0039C90635